MIDGYFYNDGLIFLRISTFYWDVTRYSNVELFYIHPTLYVSFLQVIMFFLLRFKLWLLLKTSERQITSTYAGWQKLKMSNLEDTYLSVQS